jgi:hypothetical protein
MAFRRFKVSINRFLEHTSTLFEGATASKPALEMFFKLLKNLHKDKNLGDNFIELTTQIIWTSLFGLIIKLIIEKDAITNEQREKLIEHHLKVNSDGIVFGKLLYDY